MREEINKENIMSVSDFNKQELRFLESAVRSVMAASREGAVLGIFKEEHYDCGSQDQEIWDLYIMPLLQKINPEGNQYNDPEKALKHLRDTYGDRYKG